MSYQITVRHEERLVQVHITGAMTLEVIRSFADELLQPPYIDLMYDVLFDCRPADFRDLSSNDIRSIVGYLARNAGLIPDNRHAIVVSQQLQFGMMRMFQLLVDDNPNFTCQVFYDEAEARRWLDEGPGADAPRDHS
ncbi:MAG: STAS/SEC14 domain-containing protein [Acidobacteria bacterium]|nr:STAS/SEC14 domain-containing protein [Acidobacteriota bacterium]